MQTLKLARLIPDHLQCHVQHISGQDPTFDHLQTMNAVLPYSFSLLCTRSAEADVTGTVTATFKSFASALER